MRILTVNSTARNYVNSYVIVTHKNNDNDDYEMPISLRNANAKLVD